MGRTPFGYCRALGGLEPDPKTSPFVRLIFREYLRQGGLKSLAAVLAQKGVHSPRGLEAWSRQSLRSILRNEVYVGRIRFGPILKAGTHEPLVSTRVFNQAQVLLRANNTSPRKSTAREIPPEVIAEMALIHRERKVRQRTRRAWMFASALEVRKEREARRAALKIARAKAVQERAAQRHPLFAGSGGRGLRQLLSDVDDLLRIVDADGKSGLDRWLSMSGSKNVKSGLRRWGRIKRRMRLAGIELEVSKRAIKLSEEGRDRYEGLKTEHDRWLSKQGE